jgi:DNA modification methylase
MIRDVHLLGYLNDDDVVLDPTYGKGAWWRLWQPGRLVTRDRKDQPWWDFRDMRILGGTLFVDQCVDAVAFDPPYVSGGGIAMGEDPSINRMRSHYDMNAGGTGKTSQSSVETQENVNLGLAECYRVCRKGGIVLVKCQDYVQSGKLWLGTHHTLTAALELGFKCQDRLEMVGRPRPQPSGRGPQKHARRNLSTLFVLQRPKRG